MNGKTLARIVAICGVLILFSLNSAWSADYSVTVSNNIYKTTNEHGSSCYPVSFTYWSGGNGSKAQLSDKLGAYTPKTLTIKNAGSCSSMELTVTCHFFQTSYTNYGKLSQTSSGYWTDDSKTQSIPCGNHTASVELSLYKMSSNALTVLAITSP